MLTLAGTVMRRAVPTAAAVMAAGLLIGLLRMKLDVSDEVLAAGQLARVVAVLGQASGESDGAVLARLQALARERELRHLSLRIDSDDGHLLLAVQPERAPSWLAPVLDGMGRQDVRGASWALHRPSGAAWRVTLEASAGGEQREAAGELAAMLGLLLAGAIGLVASMWFNLARALHPLGRLLDAIAGLGRQDHTVLQALPPMPVTEMASIAQALRGMDHQLQVAREQSRQYGQKLLVAQEEERARLAHDLHDELGQRLTAMRVELAHLLRGQPEGDGTATALQRLQAHTTQLQRDVRAMLAGLQPFGPTLDEGSSVAAERLHTLLLGLTRHHDEASAPRVDLTWQVRPAAGAPGGDLAAALPRDLALVLYRITQETLTNAMRHSGARHVAVQVAVDLDARAHPARVLWTAQDDGFGIGDIDQALQRGNGLAGIQQRVFSAGGDLVISAARSEQARPGLRLAAELPVFPQACPPAGTASPGALLNVRRPPPACASAPPAWPGRQPPSRAAAGPAPPASRAARSGSP